jgi:uncharacterized protein YggE
VQNIQSMPNAGQRMQAGQEGIVVTGEAVRRASPEAAEFLVEITTGAASAAQALRDNQARTAQVANALHALGLQSSELQTVSLDVYNLYAPLPQPMPAFVPQLSPAGAMAYQGQPAPQSDPQFKSMELQFGAYQARNTLRVTIREASRAGEAVDTITKSGAAILGGFSVRAQDEAGIRRAALEAAGKDARSRAEALASATGKKIGDPIAVSEELVASNGTYMALRAAMPLAFGTGAPHSAGELEYYARVSASFRFQ